MPRNSKKRRRGAKSGSSTANNREPPAASPIVESPIPTAQDPAKSDTTQDSAQSSATPVARASTEGGPGFSVASNGSIAYGRTPGSAVMTNVAVWYPAVPQAFDNARDAKFFTRIGTRHSYDHIKAAFDITPQVKQTFWLSVNNVILIFSNTADEHTSHVRAVLEMLRTNSITADIRDSVFDVSRSSDAGVRLEQIGTRKVYMVINEGVRRQTS